MNLLERIRAAGGRIESSGKVSGPIPPRLRAEAMARESELAAAVATEDADWNRRVFAWCVSKLMLDARALGYPADIIERAVALLPRRRGPFSVTASRIRFDLDDGTAATFPNTR